MALKQPLGPQCPDQCPGQALEASLEIFSYWPVVEVSGGLGGSVSGGAAGGGVSRA